MHKKNQEIPNALTFILGKQIGVLDALNNIKLYLYAYIIIIPVQCQHNFFYF